jgi:hypothetical protein
MEREAQRPNSSLQQLAKHRRREGPEPGAGGRLSRGEEKGGTRCCCPTTVIESLSVKHKYVNSGVYLIACTLPRQTFKSPIFWGVFVAYAYFGFP